MKDFIDGTSTLRRWQNECEMKAGQKDWGEKRETREWYEKMLVINYVG